MTLELQVQEPVLPREQRIRKVFEDNGSAMSVPALARACVDSDVFTPDEMKLIAMKEIGNICRRALRVKDDGGLPSVGATTETDEDGAPVWKARQGWLFPEYEMHVASHIGQRNEDHLVALKLAAEAEARFRMKIAIPELPEA